jgi:hypothetical protein
MSVWYDVKVTAYGTEEDLARLLNVKSDDISGLNEITLEFGQKNSPGVNLDSLAKNNPGLTLLVHTTVECHSGSMFLLRHDPMKNEDQYIPLERFDYEQQEYNRKLIVDFPKLEQELAKNKFINWKYFCFDVEKIQALLNKHEEYQDTVSLVTQEDIDFDNAELIDD